MSDVSDDLKNDRQNDSGQDNICRDFIRGLCERKFCKYKHENEVRHLNFCHDFQNTLCPRPNCKFIHCTTDEVEEYKRTGEMSNQILVEATRKNQLPGAFPVCNQFRKGSCRRSFCKFRHVTKEEEDAEIMELIQNNPANRQRFEPINNGLINSHEPQITRLLTVKDVEALDFEPPPKRRFIQTNDGSILENEIHINGIPGIRGIFKGYFAGNPPAVLGHVDARSILLEEEISLLHKEIAQLKRQVSDLMATNEFLLDQNATLRVTGKRNGSVSVPSVTITNTLPQNNTVQQPQPQQVIRTVTASVATVPVSLATVTTCNPVSCNPVSIAGCPVSIASPAQILAPSQQILVTTNPSTQLAIADSSQAQLAIAQQNLVSNLAQQAAQPQLTSQTQLALATTTQQLTSQAQHIANQQLALASAPQLTSQTQLAIASNAQQLGQQLTSQAQQLASQQLTNQAQQLANQQLTNQAQQLANQQLTNQAQQLANQQLTNQAQHLANQQLTNQAQQLANQQLTSQAQQLALANTALANTSRLTSQAQQLALANTPQQLAVANMPQQLALAGANQQLLAQQNLASSQQLEMHRNNQINAINTSQAIAMSNATQPMMSYPIMTQTMMTHALQH